MAAFFSNITASDCLYAGILAVIFTWLITNITKIYRAVKKRPVQFGFQPRDIGRIIQKCCALFPYEIVQFHGETFRRGMKVRVTTISNKIFEGKLIGLNSENIVCVLTESFIAADMLDNITDIVIISES